jgi:shikimate 5-dehydrogenase
MEDFFYLFMKKFGLIGYPLEHSFSKFYFTEKFKKEGIQATYENFSLSNLDNLKTILFIPTSNTLHNHSK